MSVRHVLALGLPAVVVALVVSGARGSPTDDAAARLRCATRLSLSITGKSPDPALIAQTDPQSQVDVLLADDAFVEQFSRYMNSQLNPEPGETPQRDATYYLTRHVLQQKRPWHELFDGPYDVVADGTTTPASAKVIDNPDGLGYFRSRPWMLRYAGNEQDGYRLVAAFRIQQNIIGLDVSAVTTAPDVDISATGRMSSACSSCHYDSYFALDKVAKILSRKTGPTDNPTFTPSTDPPQQLLDGRMIGSDKELVTALVESTDYKFRQCRLVFQYLYGRAEANCESPLFDSCIDVFEQTGDIRAAIKTVAQDASFCE